MDLELRPFIHFDCTYMLHCLVYNKSVDKTYPIYLCIMKGIHSFVLIFTKQFVSIGIDSQTIVGNIHT